MQRSFIEGKNGQLINLKYVVAITEDEDGRTGVLLDTQAIPDPSGAFIELIQPLEEIKRLFYGRQITV